MTHPRFFLPESLDGPEAELTGLEAHHLLHVLRLRPGERIELFDGEGTEAVARIEATEKKRVRLAVLSRRSACEELPGSLTLATALPKGDRFRWLVEKATELGVSRLIPLRTKRSVVDPRAAKLEKMRAAVIAACKQSGRSRLMEISPPQNWEDLLNRETANSRVLIAHPGGRPWHLEMVSGADRVILGIGPEGGFSPEELSQAQPSATLVSLGPRILRIETAALALSTLAVTAMTASSG